MLTQKKSPDSFNESGDEVLEFRATPECSSGGITQREQRL